MNLRRSGRTTRIVDNLIQELFTIGSIEFKDHYYSDLSKERVGKIIRERLYLEHRLDGDSREPVNGEKLFKTFDKSKIAFNDNIVYKLRNAT